MTALIYTGAIMLGLLLIGSVQNRASIIEEIGLLCTFESKAGAFVIRTLIFLTYSALIWFDVTLWIMAINA